MSIIYFHVMRNINIKLLLLLEPPVWHLHTHLELLRTAK